MEPFKIWEDTKLINDIDRQMDVALRIVGELNTIYKTVHPSFSEGIQTDQIRDALYLDTFVEDRMIDLGGFTFANGLELHVDKLRELVKMPEVYSEFVAKRNEFMTFQSHPNYGTLRYDLLCNEDGEIVVDTAKYNDAIERLKIYIDTTTQFDFYNDVKSLIDLLNQFTLKRCQIIIKRQEVDLLKFNYQDNLYSLSWHGASYIKKIE